MDIPLIEYVASKGKPIVMSCGMGSIEEIEEALAACQRQHNENVVLLKCCSQYPAQFEDMNVSVIPDMQKRFQKTGRIIRPFIWLVSTCCSSIYGSKSY